MATKNAKNTNMNFTFDNTIKTVKDTANNVNTVAIETTEDLVNEVITRSTQWQKVSAKAIDGGFKLVGNQQEIVFDALESLKGQVKQGSKRFKGLFSNN